MPQDLFPAPEPDHSGPAPETVWPRARRVVAVFVQVTLALPGRLALSNICANLPFSL